MIIFLSNRFLLLVLFAFFIDGALSINVGATVPPKIAKLLGSTNITEIRKLLRNGTRRIISGTEVYSNKPFMVYLKLPISNPKYKDYKSWLCGGVIIHEEYILTSAACIEDARHFYIVAGTYRHNIQDDKFNNLCIRNGAKKAVWKCVPRNYIFDGHENDNIRWMNNDIAVVRVEDEFDFERKIRGCDFIPKPICYNNQSVDFEKPGTEGVIAGWGSIEKYSVWVNTRRQDGTQNLLETPVTIIPKKKCKLSWGTRYHNIIENYMICTKDLDLELTDICREKYADCDSLFYDDEGADLRRQMEDKDFVVHTALHNTSNTGVRRSGPVRTGGFCENDHGGPLIYGSGSNAVVVGIISACLVKDRTNKCYGPFLYTSIWKNKNLINCAVYKEIAPDCSKIFRSSGTHVEEKILWADHPDGPSKLELRESRKQNERT